MDLSDELRGSNFACWCHALERALCSGSLPGPSAQRRMAPRPRRLNPAASEGTPRQGSVLLLLHPDHNGICLPVTLRSERVAYHKSQISLPGGTKERDDVTLLDTALRETSEEIGIRRDDVRVLGKLTPLYVPASHSCIHPYVACHPAKPMYRINPDEVAEVIELPLQTLMDPRWTIEEEWEIQGQLVRVPFYQLGRHKVWGATAMILSELAALLADAPGLAHSPNPRAC